MRPLAGRVANGRVTAGGLLHNRPAQQIEGLANIDRFLHEEVGASQLLIILDLALVLLLLLNNALRRIEKVRSAGRARGVGKRCSTSSNFHLNFYFLLTNSDRTLFRVASIISRTALDTVDDAKSWLPTILRIYLCLSVRSSHRHSC